MSLIEQRTRWLIPKIAFIGLGLILLLSSSLLTINGLAQANPGWSDPINLSKSGFADTPSMVIDSEGIYHVIWQDADAFCYDSVHFSADMYSSLLPGFDHTHS